MGSVNAKLASTVVMPEVLSFSEGDVLLLHGTERGKSFWWPPGAYWIAEKACDLQIEEPADWVRRVLLSQIGADIAALRLRSVEFINEGHPPVFVYEVELQNEPNPSPNYDFDEACFFPITNLPKSIGRDDVHGLWLKQLLMRVKTNTA